MVAPYPCVCHSLSLYLSISATAQFQSNLFVLVVLWIGFNSVKQLVNNTKCSDTNKRTQWPQPKRIALLSSFESIIKSSFWYKITHVIVAAETSRKNSYMYGHKWREIPEILCQPVLIKSIYYARIQTHGVWWSVVKFIIVSLQLHWL